jgi:hypothetical protein
MVDIGGGRRSLLAGRLLEKWRKKESRVKKEKKQIRRRM